jgi:hypothetical protein
MGPAPEFKHSEHPDPHPEVTLVADAVRPAMEGIEVSRDRGSIQQTAASDGFGTEAVRHHLTETLLFHPNGQWEAKPLLPSSADGLRKEVGERFPQ